jgi:hypothetical protein
MFLNQRSELQYNSTTVIEEQFFERIKCFFLSLFFRSNLALASVIIFLSGQRAVDARAHEADLGERP